MRGHGARAGEREAEDALPFLLRGVVRQEQGMQERELESTEEEGEGCCYFLLCIRRGVGVDFGFDVGFATLGFQAPG